MSRSTSAPTSPTRKTTPSVLYRGGGENGRRPGESGHRARRVGQRRADRRQQGARSPVRPGVERGDRVAGPPAQQRATDRHRRSHALRAGRAGNRRRVRDHAWSKAERHQRRIDILAEYERTHIAPLVPGAPARYPQGTRSPAGPAASAPLRPRAGAGIQPAGPIRRRRRRRRRPDPQASQRVGQASVPPLRRRPRRHVHLGVYGTFIEASIPMPLPSGRSECGWSAPNTASTFAARPCAR